MAEHPVEEQPVEKPAAPDWGALLAKLQEQLPEPTERPDPDRLSFLRPSELFDPRQFSLERFRPAPGEGLGGFLGRSFGLLVEPFDLAGRAFSTQIEQHGIPITGTQGFGIGPFRTPLPEALTGVALPIPGLTNPEQREAMEALMEERIALKGAPLDLLERFDVRVEAQSQFQLPFGVRGALEQLPFIPIDIATGLPHLAIGIFRAVRGVLKELPGAITRIRQGYLDPKGFTAQVDELLDPQSFDDTIRGAFQKTGQREFAQTIERGLERIGLERGSTMHTRLVQFARSSNPSAFPLDEVERGIVTLARQAMDDDVRTLLAIAPLHAGGSFQRSFGPVSKKTGKFTRGPLKGTRADLVVSNPSKHVLTEGQQNWVKAVPAVNDEILRFGARQGIETAELARITIDPARRLWGLVDRVSGTIRDVGIIGRGTTAVKRIGTFAKPERFADEAAASAKGFVPLLADDIILHNAGVVFARARNQRFADWVVKNLPVRVRGTISAALREARLGARAQVKAADGALALIRRALRGERVPAAALQRIGRFFPETAARFERTALSFDETVVLRVVRSLRDELQTKFGIRSALVAEKLRNASLAPAARDRLTFSVVERQLTTALSLPPRKAAAVANRIFAELVKRPRKEAKAAMETLRDEMASTRTVLREVEKSIAEEMAEITTSRTRLAGEVVLSPKGELGPAFKGLLMTGSDASSLAKTLKAAFVTQTPTGVESALKPAAAVSAVVRFFVLAGDMSAPFIQLFYLAMTDPKAWANSTEAFGRSLLNPDFFAKYLTQADNLAVIQKLPGLALASKGGTDITEALGRGGLLQLPVIRSGAKVLGPFQRGFEVSIDVAGVEMGKALQHLATTPERIDDVTSFINAFRGIGRGAAALGMSPGQQSLESTLLMLAPRYTRAIGTLLMDFTRGGLRGDLARKNLTHALVSLHAQAFALSLHTEGSVEGALSKINPASFDYLTWDIAGQQVGLGGKVRSIMTTLAQAVGDVISGRGENLGKFSRENALLRLYLNQAPPAIDLTRSLVTGRNWRGDPLGSNLVEVTANLAKENLTPVWVQSAAFDGGTAGQRSVRGAIEFLGLRAFSKSFQSRYIEFTEDYWKERGQTLRWSKMDNAQQKEPRVKTEAGKELWDAATQDRLRRGLVDEARAEQIAAQDIRNERFAVEGDKHQAGTISGPAYRDIIQEAAGALVAEYLRIENRHPDYFEELAGLPPSDIPNDELWRQWMVIQTDPAYWNEVTNLYDYDAKERASQELLADIPPEGRAFIQRFEALNREALHPAAAQYYRDVELLGRRYWKNDERVLRQVAPDLLSAYRIYKYRTRGKQLSAEDMVNFRIVSGLDQVWTLLSRSRRLVREQDPEVDAALMRWYSDVFQPLDAAR